MPLKVTRLYQVVLRDPAAPISIRLRRTFSDWIETKGLPPADAGLPTIEREVGGVRLRMERRGDCGRYTVEEPDGLRVRVTYAESVAGMTGWVVVTVDGPQEVDGPHRADGPRRVDGRVAAPGFVRHYLRTSRVTDGGVHLEDEPVVLDERDVPRFVHAMTEPRRRVPIVVVSVHSVARARAETLAAAVAGAALVVRLADLRAQDCFNQAMGGKLQVFGGGIRTYVAPCDPATESYPFRHPPMGGGMLRDQGALALAKVAEGVIGETVHRPLPEDVQQTMRVVYRVLDGRAEVGDIAAAITARPVGRPAKAESDKEDLRRRMMALAHRPAVPAVPAVPEPQESAPEPRSPELAPELPPDLAQLVAERVVRELRGELEAALSLTAGDAATILREIRELADRIGWLELRLTEVAGPVRAGPVGGGPVGGPVRAFAPAGLAEVLAQARDTLRHVVIGDTDAAAARLDLDHRALCRSWAVKAWDALRALDDFARCRSAGEFAGGFHDWCASGGPGRLTIPTGMVAMRESRTVAGRSKYSDPRTFPVPPEVDPSGQVVMEAHVKLRPVGYPAPRMYFHDDSGGVTGKIWVGYLGEHLPNTRTN